MQLNNEEIKRLNKVVDQLEQRIAALEKVLQSHAKCIGELREILKVYHYESDTENMSKDVVTSLENIIIGLTS